MGKALIDWCYKWLPIIMGCHCRPERSFHVKGRSFPVCARCTGMLAGFLICLLSCFFWQPHPAWMAVLMLPGIIDGTVQMKTSYTSNNLRRLWTGLLMGYGSMSLLTWSLGATYRLGFRWGLQLFGK